MTQIVLVVNSLKADADQAQALRREVASECAAAGWPEPELRLTTERDPGTAAARDAVRHGAAMVVACGGDGTVNAVAEALADTGVCLGVVPMGTGNLLAANLGIPTSTGEAVKVLVHGVDQSFDLGQTGERVFTGIAGLGLDAAMAADAPAALKKRIGWPAYLVPIARHLADPGFTLTLDLDGLPVRHHGVRTALIGNIGRVHGGLDLLPDADPQDGILDVAVLAPRGRLLGWLPVLARLGTGRLRGSDTVFRYRARHVVAHTDRAVDQELDGEPYRRADGLEIQVRPGALTVRVPADSADTPGETRPL